LIPERCAQAFDGEALTRDPVAEHITLSNKEFAVCLKLVPRAVGHIDETGI
jgi:hypothetical protein